MKTRIKYVILLLIVFSDVNLKAEFDYEFSGYVYEMPIIMKTPEMMKLDTSQKIDDMIIMNLTRLRLRPDFWLTEDTRITLNYEMDLMLTKTDIPFFSGGMTNRQAIDLHSEIYNENNVLISHFIDMFYIKHMFEWGEFSLGRQVISWGTGRVWQPTDLFTPINPANFSKFEKDGADCFTGKVYLGEMTDVEFVVNFREQFDDYNYAGRIRTNHEGFDFSIMGAFVDKKGIIGGDFAGNFLWGTGIRGEAIFSNHNKDSDSSYVRAILGLDYQISSDWYALIEAQYNGEGTTCKLCYDALLARMMRGEIQNIGKYYTTINSTYQLTSLISLAGNFMTNVADGSGYVGLTGTYSATENLNLGGSLMVFYGDDDDEYGMWPTSLFVLGQWYF